MIAVLSPSKTMTPLKVSNLPEPTLPVFLDAAAELVEIMRTFDSDALSKLMGISSALARLNFERYFKWELPFTPNNSTAAIAQFKGDVYEGLNAEDLSRADLEFAQDHIRILSGLYGIIRPLDLIQPYRLEMGLKLEVNEHRNLYSFWGNRLTEGLKSELKSKKVLVNLASQEYFRAIDPKVLASAIITPEFKERKGNNFKVVAIHAKRARGLMSRFIVRNRIADVERIKEFSSEGYSYHPDLSSGTKWVFAR